MLNSLKEKTKSILFSVKSYVFSEDADEPTYADLDDDEDAQQWVADLPKGTGYDLVPMSYRNPRSHSAPFFFVSPLGDPFPSSQMNPLPEGIYSRWTKIPNVRPPCESITAPRIRFSPPELQAMYKTLQKMSDAATKEPVQPNPRVLNLCGQRLGDPFQYEAFLTFLELNKNVEVLNLNDNELETLLDIDLTRVRQIYLSDNSVATFLSVPAMPQCEVLHISRNFVSSTAGLNEDRFPRLRKLTLKENPIAASPFYRKKILEALPKIEILDGLPIRRDDDAQK